VYKCSLFHSNGCGHAGGVLLRDIVEQGSAGVSANRRAPAGVSKRQVRTAVYLLVVLTIGAYLPTPLYPAYQHAFEFSDLTMTLIYAMFALVSAPALLVFGPASDTFGARVVLRVGIAVAALASACFVFASGPVLLLVGRAAQGLALGTATGAATALIARHTTGGARTRALPVASMAFVAGTAAGPIVAGMMAQYLPFPTVLPYGLHLALLAIGWFLVSTVARPASRTEWRPTAPHVPASMRLRFTAAAATGFLAWTAAGLFLAVIPSVLGRGAHVDNLAITGGVVGAVLVCSVLVHPLVSRVGARRAQLAGLAALLLSLVALALTGGASLPVTLAAAVVAGIGHGLGYGGATAAVDEVAPDGQRGSINGPLYLVFYLGAGVPAVAVGLLTLWYSLDTAISLLSIGAAALVPLAAVFLSSRVSTMIFGIRGSAVQEVT